MKKLLSAALALSMFASAFTAVAYADDDMTKIVTDVKERAGITEEYPDFSSDISKDDNM